MLRYSLLVMFIVGLSAYAWRDWFRALCILIVLMAFLERPDMPRTVMGIPGLNAFNIVMLMVLMSWAVNRPAAGLVWDLPRPLAILLGLYALFIVVSGVRLILDAGEIQDYLFMTGAPPKASKDLIQKYLVDTLKWILPALLIFDGCREKHQARWVIACIAITFFFLALQIIRKMGLSGFLDATSFQHRAIRVLGRDIGYHRIDLSTLMAGATWVFFCARLLFQERWARVGLLGAAAMCSLAMVLTAGRAGYLACAITGLILALVRWRQLLIIGPALALVLLILVPEVRQRAFEGFTEESHEQTALALSSVDAGGRDWYAITSGRVLVWPAVIEGIRQRPWFGYGGQGMLRSGMTQTLCEIYGVGMYLTHPHNAYLQWILDNGLISAVPVFLFYGLILRYSLQLLRRQDPMRTVVGGTCFALVFSQLIASIGAQSFYPRESAVFMWCAIALCLRYRVAERQAAEVSNPPAVAVSTYS